MSQTLVKLYAHIVFSTKHRSPSIASAIEAGLYAYMSGIVKNRGAKLVRIGGMPDHVHLLVLLSKTEALADLLQNLKKDSSKWIKQEDPGLTDFHWQDGYAAFSVSESNVDACIRYIDEQKKHHERRSFKEELLLLLQKHNVEYNERYMWD